jgi:hypothetical protein
MPNMRPRSTLTALAFALTVALPGYADVAPPSSFVETCTLEKQAHSGEECHACRAYFGNGKHCSESLSAYGFAERCRSHAASAWSEIWCRAASPSAPKVPESVIKQLSDAAGKPGPVPSGSAAPIPTPSTPPALEPAPPASAAPIASAAPPASAAPAPVAAATVPPGPPRKSGACSFGGTESGAWSLLGVALVAYIGAARRSWRSGARSPTRSYFQFLR